MPLQNAQTVNDDGFQPEQPPVDSSAMKDHVAQNIQDHVTDLKEKNKDEDGNQKPIDEKPANSLYENIVQGLDAGWQGSFSGLFARGKMPDKVLPEDAGLAMTIASQISGWAGDLPAMAAGMESGAPAGAIAGGAVGSIVPGVGTLGGSVLGAFAGGFGGAFAAPAMMRKILIDHYKKGDITDASDFAARAVAVAAEGLKAGTTGIATGLSSVGGGFLAGPLAQKIAEVASMTSVAKGLEGQLPNWKDFTSAAVVMGGFHAMESMPEIRNKIADVYKQTGVKPTDLVEMTKSDPNLKAQILSDNIRGEHIEVPSSEEQAKLGLPQFTEADILKDPGKAKELMDQDLGNERPDYSEPRNKDLSEPEKSMLSHIGEETKEKEPFLDPHQFYTDRFDFLHQLKLEEQATGKPISADKSAYIIGRTMANYMDKVNEFYNNATYDFETGKPNGEGFKTILDDAKKAGGGTEEKLNAYAIGKRRIELDNRNIIQPMSVEDAKQVVSDNQEKMDPIQRRFVELGNRTLKYYADSGMLGQENLERIFDNSSEHVPFKKILEPDEITGKIPAGNSKAIKTIGDSDLQIKNPILERFKDIEWMIKAAEFNKFKNTMIETLAEPKLNEKTGLWDTDSDIFQHIETNDNWRKLGDDEIDRKVDGKQEVWKTTPGIKDVINHFEQAPDLLPLWAKLMRPITQVTRFGYMTDWSFALRHTWRALKDSWIYSKTGQYPIIGPLEAIGSFFKKDEAFHQWMFDGGATGQLEDLSQRWFDKHVMELDKQAPYVKQAWNLATTPLQMAHQFIVLASNLTSLNEYKRSPGIMTPEGELNPNATAEQRAQAAINAREVVPDVTRIGAKMRALQATVAFYNIDLQGGDRAVRQMIADPKGTIAKSIAMYTVPSLAFWAVTHDEDWYKQLEGYKRNLYDVFKVSGTKNPITGKESAIEFKLPKGFDLGLIFGALPQRVLDAYNEHDPGAIKSWISTFLDKVPGVPVPDAIKQMVQLQANYNLFTNKPIIPEPYTKEVPEMQYNEYTSDTAKALGKVFGYVPGINNIHFPGLQNRNITPSSPMLLDYIMGMAGPTGSFGKYLTDKALQASGQAPSKDVPIEQFPYAKEFFDRYPSIKAKSIQDFEDRMTPSKDIMNSMVDAKKRGDFDEFKKLRQQLVDSDPLEKGPLKFIQDRRAAVQNLERMKMDPTQRRQLQDAAYWQMIRAAEIGNASLDQISKNRDNLNKGK